MHCKFILLSFLLLTQVAFSQHQHQEMENPRQDTLKSNQNEVMDMNMAHDSMQMSSAFSPNLPMTRDGSGTSWQPDSSPMMMYMKMFGMGANGMTSLMVHGNVFIRYTSQDIMSQSNRGGSAFDAPNWVMAMLTHKYSKDVFSF